MISIKKFANLYIKVLQNYRLKNTLSNKTNCGRKQSSYRKNVFGWKKKQFDRPNGKKIPECGN